MNHRVSHRQEISLPDQCFWVQKGASNTESPFYFISEHGVCYGVCRRTLAYCALSYRVEGHDKEDALYFICLYVTRIFFTLFIRACRLSYS
jgi:hypothetical protein